MTKKEILNKLKKLDIPQDDYCLVLDTALVMQGLKDTSDEIELALKNKANFNIAEIKLYNDFYWPKYMLKIDNYQVLNIEGLIKAYKLLKKDKQKIKILEDYLVADNYFYEKELNKEGYTLIAGVDEVGRGPLVGPVVAAAVILPVGFKLEGLTDSKKLSEKKRNLFYDIIMKEAIAVGIGQIEADVIDKVNIYEASKLAMIEAIKKLTVKPEYVLIDAMKINIGIPQKGIVHGDALSISIAASSVIAKVTRDRMMDELDVKYPMYGFRRHKGYPTKEHIENVKKYGVLKNYRFTYGPIRDLISKEESSEAVNENMGK